MPPTAARAACLFLIIASIQGVEERVFPRLYDIGSQRPVSSWPSSATCGVQTRTAFCASSTLAASLDCASSENCEQLCPFASALPPPTSHLLAGRGYGACVVRDTINRAPQRVGGNGNFSAMFLRNRAACAITPDSASPLGKNSAFTFASYVYLVPGNDNA